MTQHDKCRCGADLPRTEPGVELASRHIPGGVECLTRQVAAADERADKAKCERNAARAACAEVLDFCQRHRFTREDSPAATPADLAEAAAMRTLECAINRLLKEHGQPFLDRLTKARRVVEWARGHAERYLGSSDLGVLLAEYDAAEAAGKNKR